MLISSTIPSNELHIFFSVLLLRQIQLRNIVAYFGTNQPNLFLYSSYSTVFVYIYQVLNSIECNLLIIGSGTCTPLSEAVFDRSHTHSVAKAY